MDRPHGQAQRAKQCQIEHHHQAHALPGVAGIDIALNPIGGATMRVFRMRLWVGGFSLVKLGARQKQSFQAACLWAVRIFLRFAFGVVLAMHAHEIRRFHTRADPQPASKEVRNNRMQIQGAMRHGAVQINCHGTDCDVRGEQGVEHDLPPSGLA